MGTYIHVSHHVVGVGGHFLPHIQDDCLTFEVVDRNLSDLDSILHIKVVRGVHVGPAVFTGHVVTVRQFYIRT